MPELKVSLLMPVFNDADTLAEAIESVIAQDYRNWELIMINDGSTDRSLAIMQDYAARYPQLAFTVLTEENADQLNALRYGSQAITGDLVYILHGDDRLADPTALARMNHIMQDPVWEGVIADMAMITNEGTPNGVQKVARYAQSRRVLAQQTLWLGRNLFADPCVWRRDVFFKHVVPNYLTWNTVPWLDLQKQPPYQLRLAQTTQPFMCYRMGTGHYADSALGTLNIVNGELRTLVSLLSSYRLPLYRQQYLVFRVMNRLGLLRWYQPAMVTQPTPMTKVGPIVALALSKYPALPQNGYTEAILAFYRHPSSRRLELALPPEVTVPQGKDMRVFNRQLLAGELAPFFQQFFAEMAQGFGTWQVAATDHQRAADWLRFMNIWPYVTIEEEAR